jgi:Ca-activated chloride channel homolog
MRAKWIFLTIILLSVVGFSQTKTDDDEVLRVETQLVDVPIVVTDKFGRAVTNLKRNNFSIFEDGKLQNIESFGPTSAPFEVTLLLDTSGSTRNELGLIRQAAETFINTLRPGDRVSMISFATKVVGDKRVPVTDVLSPLTDDRKLLKDALAKVQMSFGTPYYESLEQMMEKVFDQPAKDEFRGRRALVALTDGVDSVSEIEFDEVRDKILKSGIASYFVQVDTREFFEDRLLGDCESDEALRFSKSQIRRYYRKFYPKVNASRAEKVQNFCDLGSFERLAISKKLYELANFEMYDLAGKSGGKVFPVSDLSEAKSAFAKVAQDIGVKYSLGYYSTNDKRDGSYRKIRIELKNVLPGTQIRARDGYKAPTN